MQRCIQFTNVKKHVLNLSIFNNFTCHAASVFVLKIAI